MKIAIVASEFNESVCEKLLASALERSEELNIPADDVKVIRVPGAIEIPLTAKLLARTKKYNAIVCLGAVIRGETSHYDYVCDQVSQGCQQAMMSYDVPVIFGVLTTDTKKQAFDRVVGPRGQKGKEAMDTAVQMVKVLASIE